MDPDRLWTAHADAWEVHGRYREPVGGGVHRLPGIRLMATGLPHPQWNSADATGTTPIDIDAVRQWYDEKHVPWGVRVPLGAPWAHGRRLLSQRLMGVEPDGFRPASAPDGIKLRRASADDVDAVLAVDTEAFDVSDEMQRPWLAPILAQPTAVVCVAEWNGSIVGGGHYVLSDGDAGPAAYVAGIGVATKARRRGIGAAVSSWLVGHGFSNGAGLAHLTPDTDEAARIYSRLGFVQVPGFDIYVDC